MIDLLWFVGLSLGAMAYLGGGGALLYTKGGVLEILNLLCKIAANVYKEKVSDDELHGPRLRRWTTVFWARGVKHHYSCMDVPQYHRYTECNEFLHSI